MQSSMRRPRALVAAIVLSFVASSVEAATIITTIPSWDGSSLVQSFGYPNTATYGQTVTVPSIDNVLTGFSFEMNLPGTADDFPSNTRLKGYVYAWDGDSATGAQLFASPLVDKSINGFQLVTFDTGGIALTPGATYVLFASTSGLQGSGFGSWGQPQGDVYSGGEFAFLNSGTDPSMWTTSAWTTGHLGKAADVAFEATFASRSSSVPEPTSLALVGVAMAGVVALRRRRK